MKNRYLFCLILFFFSTNIKSQNIEFKETSHDFGQIEEKDGNVHYDFDFTNTGSENLVIKQIITGCGCTAAKWSDKPYAPGETGTIRIIYHPEERKMTQFSIPTEVFVANSKPIVLTITGMVNLVQRSYVNFYDPTLDERQEYVEKKPQDDYELILQRVREQSYQKYTLAQIDKNATSLMKLMTPEGIWPQIDYQCYFRTNWEPADHLSRIVRLALAYTHPESSLYGNKTLYKAICKAVKAWNKYKPTSYNWWYNEISAPKYMAEILALMEAGISSLPQKDVAGLMDMMEKSDPRKWTGANKMDIAIHHLIRGCILKNDSIVSTNVEGFFQPLCISDKEGIREDMSYQQHNTQLYIGGYGYVFIDNVSKVAPLLINTRFALNKEKLDLFNTFVRNTFLNVFRGKYIDFSVCGRSISRKNTLDLGSCTSIFERMQKLDPDHAEEYANAINRFTSNNTAAGRKDMNKMFWLSDYMVHNRKRYDFTVRAVSDRTCRSESGNGENMWGTYVSEGATNIRVSGDEYLNIFPVWEWDKIPGTTTPAGEVENNNDWGVKGVATFVGGVSDGMYGVMAYHMEDYGMEAKKGWFMFDNEIVCLGAGIHSNNQKEIHTSINQCNLKGTVFGLDNNKLYKFEPNQAISTKYQGWIWHNRVGYYLPDSTSITMKNMVQTGKWSKINFNQPGAIEKKPVFNMWITHGTDPQNANYAYIVVPGVVSPASLKVYNTKAIEIKSNTESIQAVYNSNLDILQAIFYEASHLKGNTYTIQAIKPCVVLIKGLMSERPEIFVKDPTNKEGLKAGQDVILKKL